MRSTLGSILGSPPPGEDGSGGREELGGGNDDVGGGVGVDEGGTDELPSALFTLGVGDDGGSEEGGKEEFGGAGHPGLEEPLTLGRGDDGVGEGVGSDNEGGGNEGLMSTLGVDENGGVEEGGRLELGGGVPFDRFPPPPKTNSEAFAQNATIRLTYNECVHNWFAAAGDFDLDLRYRLDKRLGRSSLLA